MGRNNPHGYLSNAPFDLFFEMITDLPATDQPSHSAEEVQLRKQALRRTWRCPGAGFALIGNGMFAIATFFASVMILPAFAWLAYQPATCSFATAIVVLVIADLL